MGEWHAGRHGPWWTNVADEVQKTMSARASLLRGLHFIPTTLRECPSRNSSSCLATSSFNARKPRGEDPLPRCRLPPGPYRQPGDVCRPPGTPSTSCNRDPRRSLPGGIARQCWTRPAGRPRQSDLLLGRMLLAGRPAMVFTSRSDGELAVTDFCLICDPLIATVSLKSSLPQLATSVSMALISDRRTWSVTASGVGRRMKALPMLAPSDRRH